MKDGQYRHLHTIVSGSQKLKNVGTGKPRWFRIACQLVYTWIIPWCDDDGRIKAEVFQIKANILPYVELSEAEIADVMVALDEIRLINWYSVNFERYIEVIDFRKYNPGRKDRYKTSIYPPWQPTDNQLTTNGCQLTTNGQPTDNPKSISTSISTSIPTPVIYPPWQPTDNQLTTNGCQLTTNGQPTDNPKSISTSISTSIPTPVAKTKKDNGVKLTPQQQIRWELFFDVYQNKENEERGKKAFKTLNPNDDLTKTIIMNVKVRNKSDPQWLKNDGEFIPLAANYLKDKRWHDILTPPKKEARYDF